MPGHAGAPGGLSAAELQAAIDELQALCGTRVLDVVPLAVVPSAEDLLLVLQAEGGDKQFLHLALGGTRARLTTTARRFGRGARLRSQTADVLTRELGGARLTAITAADGERRCRLTFTAAGGDLRALAMELFGARGLYALLDAEDRVLALSRPVQTAVRCLTAGDLYQPPPPGGGPAREARQRFSAPVLASIDACYADADQAAEVRREHDLLRRAAERGARRAQQKHQGLQKQLAASEGAEELRSRADLMLAYAHGVPRGASSMQVFHPETGAPISIDLDPSRTAVEQAQKLYDKARRLTDGREVTIRRLQQAASELEALTAAAATVEAIDTTAADTGDRLQDSRDLLERLRALPPTAKARPKARTGKPQHPPGENFRRFVSAEGYQILVGRNNAQNDRLTMRTAKGNDLWLHIGGGRPGSHVVVRLPKQKTASLETLLDAATLAVHFSKARGERRIDVIYTQKKHVRKPKGLPAGAVVPAQTRTIAVEIDEARLRRLLDSGGEGD